MAVITVKELQALNLADDGKRISMGESMYGTVRVGKDGAVSLYVKWRYKAGGKLRQIPLGTWKDKGGQTLKALRDERDRLAVELKAGIDPIERKALERRGVVDAAQVAAAKAEADLAEAMHAQRARLAAIAEQAARLTVRGLFGQWKALELRQRADKGAEAERAFERDVFPLIGDVAAGDITKAHVQLVIDSMMTRDVVRMTKRVLSDLRQMFGFALDRDLVEADPTARIKKAKIGPDVERDRVLSEAELISFFAKLPAAGLADTSQCALLIQLSTLARIGEVLGARWEHVDFERQTWVLPTTKNGKAHAVKLNGFALRQFERLHKLTGSTAWCFPASRTDGPVCPKTVTKQVADRQRVASPMTGRSKQIDALTLAGGHWRPHDLRRTGATLMADLGALPDVIERCLNHTEESKIKRIYQRAKYEAPMKDAWRLLGERLELLSAKPANVLTLKVT
ncbi:site-specific integrase [Paucibacter sp. TC2R-5]|uniref:tyrosine-type recombinase/integrase n=1 Tax=Paucibacter sp. TC2R-5 TaxID=2893555 RepID=UPI0021E48D93|nr:site-specific integrase [Paucibacter sp. TC2R-5]MCV2358873.1 site-specific integrase [Paucibacter sp. TC2R-5]